MITLYEKEFYTSSRKEEEKTQLLLFSVANEFYTIEPKYIREIINLPFYTPIPNVPEHIIGVFNFRGDIISLTDLSIFLNISTQDITNFNKIIIIENNEFSTGLLVSNIENLITISQKNIEEEISIFNTPKTKIIYGQFHHENKVIACLNGLTLIHETRVTET